MTREIVPNPPLTQTTLPTSRWERIKRFFSLQPFGDEMLTPSVFMWTYAARILVFAMALLEACAWGWFGAGVAGGWLGVGLGLTLGLVVFLVVWSLDVSLMTSDTFKKSFWQTTPLAVLRLSLTAVSVWLSAPYLTQLVFRADIEADLRREQNRVLESARREIASRSDAEIAKLNRIIRADREALILEVSGRGRSGRYGDGLTSGAIRERILANEAAVQALETHKQTELADFNQAAARNALEDIKRRWGVDLPSDSPIERRARSEKVLMRPEAQSTKLTVEGGFWLVCAALVVFKLFLQNQAASHYFSEDKQSLWRQYRKGAFDAWLPPCDRSTGTLMSPVNFLQWYDAALPKLRVAAHAEYEAEQAQQAAAKAAEALKTARAECDAYLQNHRQCLTDLYTRQVARDTLQSELAGVAGLYANLAAQEGTMSLEALQVLDRTRRSLDDKRAALEACERESRGLHFQKADLVEGYNRLVLRVEQLEAELERRQAEFERLNEVARQLRCEVAALSVGGSEALVTLLARAIQPSNPA